MSLIVENGTGLTNAESYISVAAATAYHAAQGNAAWANVADDAAREVLLRRATTYMQQFYGQRWKGIRISSVQALDWPRYNVVVGGYPVPGNSVPQAIANACAELALRAISGPLAPDVGRVKSRVKIGPLETEYQAGAPAVTTFRSVDATVAPYFAVGGMNIGLVRA